MAEFTTLQNGIKNIAKIPELRNRILFMMGLLIAYRIGSFIPTPGIDSQALQEFFNQQGGTIFGMLNMFVGGNLSRLSIFSPTKKASSYSECEP